MTEYAIARADGWVDSATAMAGLAIWGVDDLGLDKVDRFILDAIVSKFGGGPVGLTTRAIAVGEEPETIEAAYEPFLVQQGLVMRTPPWAYGNLPQLPASGSSRTAARAGFVAGLRPLIVAVPPGSGPTRGVVRQRLVGGAGGARLGGLTAPVSPETGVGSRWDA